MISTILLDKNNYYIDDRGQLPERPIFDKKLLFAFCYGQYVSQEGYKLLPPSIKNHVYIDNNNITIAITIKEIAELSNVLIVIRSNKDIIKGKKFRFNNFYNLIKQNNIEIWVKNF